MNCPFCKTSTNSSPVTENMFLCGNCHIIYNTAHTPVDYNDSYFLGDYEKQYGKSYEDDYENIYSLSTGRLNSILKFFPDHSYGKLELLEVGSALGFFLKCAMDTGIKIAKGIEISAYAADYCRSHYNIPVINSSFEDAVIDGKYDIISAWFFLEHCPNPLEVLKRLKSHLKKGGVLGLSMPSYMGPMFYFQRSKWIESHPVDHRIDVSPLGISLILKNIGFKKIIVKPCGFHPGRIISENSLFFPVFKNFYRVFSKAKKFSDTIEIYAQA